MFDDAEHDASYGRYECGDQSGEILLHKCCADLGVSEKRALEILEWAQENSTQSRPTNGNGFHQAVGIEKFARLMVEFENSWLGNRLLLYALNSSALDDVLGHKMPSEFAREQDCTRANATKLLKYIQKSLGLPPRKGQRTDATRQKQSEVRKSQLK